MEIFDIGQYAEFLNEYNEKRLTELGFLRIPGHTRLLICPRCFGSVLADVAEQHWDAAHVNYRYFVYTGVEVDKGYIKSFMVWRELPGEDEALRLVRDHPSYIVMAVEV